MGKPTKSSGGDERNMSVRKYKSTSKASSDDASLAERQREIESPSRSKNSVTAVKPGPAKSKSKLRSPVKLGLGQPVNRVNKPNIVSVNKEVKKAVGIVKSKSQMTKMKPETETVERKQKVENKEITEQVENVKQVLEAKTTNEEPIEHEQYENGNTNGVNGKEILLTEENGKSEQNGGNEPEIIEKEEEFNLHLEADENFAQPNDNASKESTQTNNEEEKPTENETSIEEVKDDSQTSAESCSVDVVESTTSDVSEVTEPIASTEVKGQDSESQATNNDAVSYDSSITLMDVKVKLNDCLKDTQSENGNDESNIDQSKPEYAHKETTFGRTLRTISGRNSIGRMRHVTLRDRQQSPNSSLFVNTSTVSVSEDGASDSKILAHRSALSELRTSIINGTPLSERKRKFAEESSLSPKKPKTEEGGLLNASIELLKYPFSTLRRPTVEVSTSYEFAEDNKQDIKSDEGTARKWCVLM